MARSLATLAALASLLAACGVGDDELTVFTFDIPPPPNVGSPAVDVSPDVPPGVVLLSPARGPASGYFRAKLHLAGTISATAIRAVRIGGIAALDLEVLNASTLAFTVQGHPDHGPAEVVVDGPSGPLSLGSLMTYGGPADPRLSRIVAIGASLTQGVQRGTPSHHGALASPAALIARQASGYFPLPLLHPGLFPQLEPADIGPPPACEVPDIATFIAQQAAAVIPLITDPATDEVDFALARLDPTLTPHNLAVGNSNLRDLALSPQPDSFAVHFLGHLVYQPTGGVLDLLTDSQVDVLETLQPTLILSTDLMGNDFILPLTLPGPLDPTTATAVADIEADLKLLLPRLAATGAEAFLANVPRPSLLPAAAEKRAQAVARAEARGDSRKAAAAEADALVAQVDAAAAQANTVLQTLAAEHDNIHVVDFAGFVVELTAGDIVVGGHRLWAGKLGGLIGLDGVHLTDTGYAMLANVFITTINQTLGTAIAPVDLVAVSEADPERPDRTEAAGVDIDACLSGLDGGP